MRIRVIEYNYKQVLARRLPTNNIWEASKWKLSILDSWWMK